MADRENLDIVIKARGGRQAAREVAQVERAFAAVGKTAGSTRVVIDENARAAQRSSSGFASAAKVMLGFASAAALAGGAMAGVNFVSTIEQNQIAFEQFTGSAAAAAKEIESLRKLANDIPMFGFDQFATNAKKLMALGTPLERVNDDLKTMAETALGLGLGGEGIDRIALAIGQMRSTGVVQGDELRQLQEAGIKVYDYMIKAGVITKEDIGNIGEMHLDAATAIDAIMNGMARDFGGLANRAKNTWAFQMGALKNNAAAAAGALVEPIMKFAESNVLPGLIEKLQSLATWLKGGGTEKLAHYLKITAMVLSPLIALWGVHATAVALNAARMMAMGVALNIARGALILFRGAILVATAAQWLWNAAMTANPIGLIIVGIAALIGIIILVVKHWDTVKAAFVSVWNWITDHPWVTIFAGPIAPMILLATQVVKHWAKIKSTIVSVWEAIRPIIMKIIDAVKFLVEWSPAGVAKKLGVDIPFMAGGGTIPVGGAAVVGEAGPEVARNTGSGTEITPMGRGGASGTPRVLQPVHFHVEGRVFAEAMFEVGMTAAARA